MVVHSGDSVDEFPAASLHQNMNKTVMQGVTSKQMTGGKMGV